MTSVGKGKVIPKRPARPVMEECDHCGGSGEVEVFCNDCGSELFDDSQAPPDKELNPDCDYLCMQCLGDRRADTPMPEKSEDK